MATTPNFGWVTPSPTDFVTDLPADFETFADAVDADVQLIKNTADAALPETIIDAAGDLIYGSAADTAARLGIGTAGQVLTVNSGATAPEWATPAGGGGMTLIATATPSAATSVSFTSIPTTYKALLLVIENVHQSATGVYWSMRLNNDSSSIYSWTGLTRVGTTFTWRDEQNETAFGKAQDSAVIPSTEQNQGIKYKANGFCWIFNANSTGHKVCNWSVSGWNESAQTWQTPIQMRGNYEGTSAVSQIDFIRSSTQTITGTIKLYGVS